MRHVTRLVAVLALVATGLLAPAAGSTPAGTAQAADLRYFDAGNIISDAVFFDSMSMDARAVQAFLNAKGASCVAGQMPCLKDYRQDTATQPGDAYCATYPGAAQESAATILVKIGRACGINPRVLIVLLQKEQGLVTGTRPSTTRYTKATGFGCPDTAACNPAFSGFVSQVYFAARQFDRYAAGVAGSYRAGRVNTVLFNPNPACGSSGVYIANKATAGLYSYTPYQPNAAALAAGYGTGDSCSAYGNRNFWLYFTDWFGSTQSTGAGAILEAYNAAGGQAGWLGPATSGYNCGLVRGGCFQLFQNGSIYWSPATGAHSASGSIRDHWGALGWENGTLGYPTMDIWCGLVGGGCFQTFQGGSLYATSSTAQAWMVRGAIRDAWGAAGWESGSLGWPTSDENCGLVRGGCFSTFQHGSIYWSPATGARILADGAIKDRWAALKWETGLLGYPTGDTRCGLTGNGCSQAFQGGALYWRDGVGAFWVRGDIRARWAALKAESGSLGYPTTDERCGLVNGGCYQLFQNGSVYWSPATGAHAVSGGIRDAWAARKWERGFLGYPLTDTQCGLAGGGCSQKFQGGTLWAADPSSLGWEVRGSNYDRWTALGGGGGVLGYPTGDMYCGLRVGGCFQMFTGGAMYSTPATGLRVVRAPVYARWADLKWESGPLGYPINDTRCDLVGGGCLQNFEYGSLYWTKATDAHLVRGGIRDRWGALAYERGALGYPTSDENCGLVGGGCFELFQNGSIYWSPATGAHSVSGAIRDAWAARGWEAGRLGYPVEEPRTVAGGISQRFQRGTLTYNASTGTVSVG